MKTALRQSCPAVTLLRRSRHLSSACVGQPDRLPDAPEGLLKLRSLFLWHDGQVVEERPVNQERRVEGDTLLASER